MWDEDDWSLRSWMDHSAFAMEGDLVGPQDQWLRLNSLAMGSQSPLGGGSNADWNKNLTLTYRGLMVGSPTAGADRGDRLVGDATLTYRNGAGPAPDTLDARFSNIRNIDDLKDHPVTTVSFSGIDVQRGGDFGGDVPGNRIRGSFYGPNRDETAGVFEKSGIVGAFGARRQ